MYKVSWSSYKEFKLHLKQKTGKIIVQIQKFHNLLKHHTILIFRYIQSVTSQSFPYQGLSTGKLSEMVQIHQWWKMKMLQRTVVCLSECQKSLELCSQNSCNFFIFHISAHSCPHLSTWDPSTMKHKPHDLFLTIFIFKSYNNQILFEEIQISQKIMIQ